MVGIDAKNALRTEDAETSGEIGPPGGGDLQKILTGRCSGKDLLILKSNTQPNNIRSTR